MSLRTPSEDCAEFVLADLKHVAGIQNLDRFETEGFAGDEE